MSWGIVAGAAIGVVGGAIAANKSSKAAKGAANTQAQSAKDANAVQLQMYNQSRQDNEPFRQNALTAQNEYMTLLGLGSQPAYQPSVSGTPRPAGGSGPQTLGTVTGAYQPASQPTTNGIGRLLGGNPHRQLDPVVGEGYVPPAPGSAQQQAVPASSHAPTASQLTPEQAQQAAFDRFRNTPGYQFGLQTGFDQVQASAAAHGGLYSGATLKALQRYGNDYADQQGYTPYMNRLASLAGMGQTANAQNATLGMNYANQTGANIINAGNARASGLQQQGDNSAQLAAGIAGGINGIAQNYFAQRTPQTTSNYNWASSSGFGNNYGGWY